MNPSTQLNAILVADGGRQSFYVTVDISSAADYNKLRSKKKKPDEPPSRSPQPTTSPGAQDNAGPSEPLETPAPEPPAPMAIDPALEQPEEDTSFSERKNCIQILDLHKQNPLVSYQNQLYSCEWTSTLGTDVLLTAPTPDFPHPVLREKPNVSVLATSSIKLMGRPAQISSRHPTEEGAQTSLTPAPESSTAAANDAVSLEKAPSAPPVKIPLGPTPTRARQNQANFLERLIAIKAKKGEKDNVTIYTQKVNQGSGWRSQRRKASEALDMEDGEEYETTQSNRRGKGSGGRPRGSRRMRGPRTAKGGLFRDYRPQIWDTPGADIRAGASTTTTPESWDHLEGAASDGRQTPAGVSPLPAERPAHRSRSGSASASPTPPILLPVQIENAHDISSSAAAHVSPRSSPGMQSAMVVREDENEVPASGTPDVEMEDVE